MNDPSHMKKDELLLAQDMANAAQVLIKKSEYKLSLGESHKEDIEWEQEESKLYEQARKIIGE